MTPQQLSARGRLGAHAIHARGLTNVRPARAAFEERFAREVDPDGVLSEDERARRAQHALRAHMQRLSAAAARARQAKARA